ncbi:hypothetical protein B0O79_1724 [Flavobacteriaceae bacterium MAR_2009_75]|nr:hypothetical protein B0O79_1724 [Flavobacteriaceae bacterium MAR_2009_75]
MGKLFFILFLIFQISYAQKVVKKSIVNDEITSINIDVDKCYGLILDTTEGNEISVEATIEGEYKKELLVNLKQMGDTYYLSSVFQPVFENPNDKLSAHKVVSVFLKVLIPEYLSASVYGSSCNVSASGSYRYLSIALSDGDCTLRQVGEEVTVLTQSGTINLYAKGGEVKTDTKYGKLYEDKIAIGSNHYNLTSITGNINVKKTE